MKIGRVAGTVVSTICFPAFEGHRLLFCDLLGDDLEPTGEYTIAVDSVYAGAGETVLIIDEGNSARQVTGIAGAPIRAVVVGVVDEVDLARPGAPHHAVSAKPLRGEKPGQTAAALASMTPAATRFRTGRS